MADRLAAERGLVLIPPYDDDRVIAGQGTLGLEIAEDVPDLAAVLVPIGGGGLSSGVAVAVRALHPGARILGVEPEVAADAQRFAARGPHRPLGRGGRTGRTMADGVRGQAIGRRPFAHLSRLHGRRRHGLRGGDRGGGAAHRRGGPARRRAVRRARARRPRASARARPGIAGLQRHGRRRRQRRQRRPGALPRAARVAAPRLIRRPAAAGCRERRPAPARSSVRPLAAAALARTSARALGGGRVALLVAHPAADDDEDRRR